MENKMYVRHHAPGQQVRITHRPQQAEPKKPAPPIPPSHLPTESQDLFQAELAIMKLYDLETRSWSEQPIRIQIQRKPFAEGSMRAAYKVKILEGIDVHGRDRLWVLKLSKDPRESQIQYYKDVEMQAEARRMAEQYNKLGVPKHVDFVEAFVAHLPDRAGTPTCIIERFVEGRYQKYNDNWAWCNDKRNTPQAFSHWSWEASGNTMLICDLQGVGDLWTDPQIHTIDGKGFGKGNAGLQGIRQFFMKHKCNGICQALKLRSVTGRIKHQDAGTQWHEMKESNKKHLDQLNSASVGMTVDGGAGEGILLPLIVVSVHIGGPAAIAGVMRGDVLKSINQKNVEDCSAAEVKLQLSGPTGSKVVLGLQRGHFEFFVHLMRVSSEVQKEAQKRAIQTLPDQMHTNARPPHLLAEDRLEKRFGEAQGKREPAPGPARDLSRDTASQNERTAAGFLCTGGSSHDETPSKPHHVKYVQRMNEGAQELRRWGQLSAGACKPIPEVHCAAVVGQKSRPLQREAHGHPTEGYASGHLKRVHEIEELDQNKRGAHQKWQYRAAEGRQGQEGKVAGEGWVGCNKENAHARNVQPVVQAGPPKPPPRANRLVRHPEERCYV